MTKGSDMERQLTFIDVDENRLELWLKPDRVQLVVIDSRPELEAGELRRVAAGGFAEDVAPDLAAPLAGAGARPAGGRARARGGGPAARPPRGTPAGRGGRGMARGAASRRPARRAAPRSAGRRRRPAS